MGSAVTERIRQSAQTLITQAGAMADLARSLPQIVEAAAGTPYMHQIVAQVRDASLTAGATQDTFNQLAMQMMAYADRVDTGGG